MKNPTKFKIHVSKVDKDIFTSPPNERVRRNGVLEWTCAPPHYHFALNFGYNSPCDIIQEHAGPGETITATVRPDALYGEYKYFVAVFKEGEEGEEGEFLIEDPRFIIRP